jgi:ubiquinone/menaquinone biosynthesis C-methylase UbiE
LDASSGKEAVMYQVMASIYDRLMGEEVYRNWLRFVESAWGNETEERPKTILDLGCGTGTMAIAFAKQGYDVIGVDLSEHMLAIAREKAEKERVSPILWLQQNMAELEMNEKVDCILCLCDSLNYLLDEAEVGATFARVFEQLKPGGWFIFDVHTAYKFNEVFRDRTHTWNEPDLAYIWECELDEEGIEVTHELTFFLSKTHQTSASDGHLSESNLFQRYDEIHVQRMYSNDFLEKRLRNVGFEIVSVTGDFTDQPVEEEDERAFFVCKKPNDQ